jgi:hypothetical protein
MKGKGIEVGSLVQTTHPRLQASGRTRMGLRLTDSLCLFAPLVIFLAVLAWATWEIKSVNPMAFAMFAGVIAAALILLVAGVLSSRPRPAQSGSALPSGQHAAFGNADVAAAIHSKPDAAATEPPPMAPFAGLTEALRAPNDVYWL